MNHWVILIVLIALFLLFPLTIFSFMNEEIRKGSLTSYQAFCEFGTVFLLGWAYLTDWENANSTIIPLLFLGFLFLAIANLGFNITFFQKSLEAYRQKAICAICYSLSFGFLAIALFKHFRLSSEHPLVLTGILAAALVHFCLQYRYILLPLHTTYFSKLPFFMTLNGYCYSVLSALVIGIAATFCLRTLSLNETLFVHLILALLIFDFAARYQIVQGTFSKMTIAQGFWALTLGAIFVLFLASKLQGEMVFSTRGFLADWFSIRASLALLIFTILTLLTISLLVIRFVTITNAIDLTFVLSVLVGCWSLSNFIAFGVSSKFMEIGHLMNVNNVSSIGLDGSPGIRLKKIEKKVLFSSELNFIVDQYNQMADKFNLRGQILVNSVDKRIESEKDAVRGKIANELAHDIESPLAAIQTLISLPRLDSEITREILRTAVTSISDMVNRLHYRSISKASIDPRIYSAPGVIEKVFRMKEAEYSRLDDLELQLTIAPEALSSFIKVDLDSFRCAISNVMNNSKDEITRKREKGTIWVDLSLNQNSVLVSISDNGIEISDKRLLSLNEGKFDSTKHTRKPLGICSARENLKPFGGTVSFQKNHPVGVQSIIRLPLQPIPEWLTTRINLNGIKNLVVFDDDESIHQLFKARLSCDPNLSSISLISCKTEKEFQSVLLERDAQNTLFLVDYEFRGGSKTGIDYITESHLAAHSLLITGHWDSCLVLNKAKLAKVRVFPKNLVHRAEIVKRESENLDFILVEDNPIVQFAWQQAATSYGLNYRIFSDPAYLEMHKGDLGNESPLFLDFHLESCTAVDVLKNLNGEFPNYYVFTAEDKESFPMGHNIGSKSNHFSENLPY